MSSPTSAASPLAPESSAPSSPSAPSNEMHFIRFNQDCTSLAVGSPSGYKLFSLTSLDRLDPIFVAALNPNDRVTIVERLFSSSLIALVSQSAPRKLKVCHFKKGTEICNYSYSNTILAVKLNRARLVVCLEESLYIHNIRDMRILHTIKDTPPNQRGLCALSINSDNCYLAYPGSNTTGEVQLFDAFNLQAKLMIPAHDSSLAALAFNPAGTRLATASEKGTVIRVFSVEDGTRLMEFRRGVKRCAVVYSLSFSQDSQFLVLSSNTETIHVFKVIEKQPEEQQQQTTAPDDSSWLGYFNKAVSTTASYLPTQVTDTLNQARAVATVSVPTAGGITKAHNTVAIANISRQMRLLLASSDGYLYIYNLPGSDGGECILVKQHRIDPDCSNADAALPDLKQVERSEPIATAASPVAAGRGHRTLIRHGSSEDEMYPTLAAGSPALGSPGLDYEDGPAVLKVTRHESHSPKSFDESPPPALQRTDI